MPTHAATNSETIATAIAAASAAAGATAVATEKYNNLNTELGRTQEEVNNIKTYINGNGKEGVKATLTNMADRISDLEKQLDNIYKLGRGVLIFLVVGAITFIATLITHQVTLVFK